MLHDVRPRHVTKATCLELIGLPTDDGASCRGAAMGPQALRIAGLRERLEALGYAVTDTGDLAASGNRAADRLVGLARLASAAANNCLDCGSRPIFLGGDHAISMGPVAGLARHCRAAARELFVLWIDAHGDFNTPETSQTGNLHGMVLALLCGEPVLPTDDSWFAPIDPRNVAILGARSLDRDERNLLAARGVQIIDMRTIDEFGVVAPLRRFLTRVSHANGHLHVSLDLDAMDPAIAPGVGTPVPGGLSFREAHLVMELLHDSGVVGSLDLVELNPFLDHAGTSARLLVDLTASLFGQQIIERSRQGRARQPHMRRRALSLTAPEK